MDYRDCGTGDLVRLNRTDRVVRIALVDYNRFKTTDGKFGRWDEVEPIELTGDILQANGWRFGTNGEWTHPDCSVELETDDEGEEVYVITHSGRRYMTYVHEFQQLLRLYRQFDLANNFKIK